MMGERIELVGDPTTVYLLRDASENVLYVGMSKEPDRRVSSHRRKPWGAGIASVECQDLPHRLLAMAREAELIREHRPPHNVQHNPVGREDIVQRAFHVDHGKWERFGVIAESRGSSRAAELRRLIDRSLDETEEAA